MYKVSVEWTAVPVASAVQAVPTYLDQVNTPTMARGAKLHDQVFARIKELGCSHIRYLHWYSRDREAVIVKVRVTVDVIVTVTDSDSNSGRDSNSDSDSETERQ